MSRGDAYKLLLLALWAALPVAGRADRVLLAPSGDVLPPDSGRSEFLISPYRRDGSITWLQYGTPGGIELEGQRMDLLPDPRPLYAFNVQYPLLIDLNGLPAVSVGVRDLLGTSSEHRSLYFAATKGFELSRRQRRLLREIRLTGGVGTERLDGLFIGVKARLTLGITLSAECYRQRLDFGVEVPLTRGLQARVTSLNGTAFYGFAFSINP